MFQKPKWSVYFYAPDTVRWKGMFILGSVLIWHSYWPPSLAVEFSKYRLHVSPECCSYESYDLTGSCQMRFHFIQKSLPLGNLYETVLCVSYYFVHSINRWHLLTIPAPTLDTVQFLTRAFLELELTWTLHLWSELKTSLPELMITGGPTACPTCCPACCPCLASSGR